MAIPAERRKKRKQDHQSTTHAQAETYPSEEEMDFEEDEYDVLVAGRSFANAKEFMRASNLLQSCKSSKGRFMYRYFDFLVRNRALSCLQILKLAKAEEKKALRDWHNLDCE